MQSNKPSRFECTGVLTENDAETIDGGLDKNVAELKHAKPTEFKLRWHIIIYFVYAHLGAIYGVYLMFTSAKIYTTISAFMMHLVSSTGTTAGAHRLWSHRSYKATLPLKIILMLFHTSAFQYDIINWARDHRLHHKYSETDADPHNAKRGFFFAHVGWLLCEQHPDVKFKEKTIDLSDLENDPVLRFQRTYYYILVPVFGVILPAMIPIYLWNETVKNTWYIVVLFRWAITFLAAAVVNSILHLHGNHPYDRFINPTDNKFWSTLVLGEGLHNYHHVFPWDYKTGEFCNYGSNTTALFIDFMAIIGWAYDRKIVAAEMIKRRVERTGDGTHQTWGRNDENGNNMDNVHEKHK